MNMNCVLYNLPKTYWFLVQKIISHNTFIFICEVLIMLRVEQVCKLILAKPCKYAKDEKITT